MFTFSLSINANQKVFQKSFLIRCSFGHENINAELVKKNRSPMNNICASRDHETNLVKP